MIGTQDINRSCGLDFNQVVGKRSKRAEAETVSDGGAFGSENPGMSNDKCG